MAALKGPFNEKIFIRDELPQRILDLKGATFFIDSYFKGKIKVPSKRVIYLRAGEDLKTLASLSQNISKLLELGHQKKDPLVCIGGGSFGDSIGFLASVYLRGVPFYSVPTTWLSVIDSSVGGKTALNFQNFKNQIGSFYPPQEIIICKNLLASSSLEQARGEILKTLALNLKKKWAQKQFKNLDEINMKEMIKYKTSIVKKDVLDKKCVRAVLNLGHTLAHAFELEFKWNHSQAVEKGLLFALNWSLKKKFLSQKNYDLVYHNISNLESNFKKMSDLKIYLEKDKKAEKGKINFIYLSDEGPKVIKTPIDSIVKEYFRQVEGNEI